MSDQVIAGAEDLYPIESKNATYSTDFTDSESVEHHGHAATSIRATTAAIAGSVITRAGIVTDRSVNPSKSITLYRDMPGLPLKTMGDYMSVDSFEGVKHFGVWPHNPASAATHGLPMFPSRMRQ
jgi:hypothetical protein